MKNSKTNSRTARNRRSLHEVLDCGHPNQPNNLLKGKCGTCLTASELEEMAERNGGKLSKCLLGLAKIFREGKVVYDRKGKSLLEWEKHFKKQSND